MYVVKIPALILKEKRKAVSLLEQGKSTRGFEITAGANPLSEALERFEQASAGVADVRARLDEHNLRRPGSLFDAKAEYTRYEGEQADRAQFISAAFEAYDAIFEAMSEYGFLEGTCLYPCIGGDVLAGRHTDLVGVAAPGMQSVQGANEDAAKLRMEEALDSFESADRLLFDLASTRGIESLKEAIGDRDNPVKSVILKNTSDYLSRDGQNFSEDLAQMLGEALEDPTIILFNSDVDLTAALETQGFELVPLPAEIASMVERFKDEFLAKYIENGAAIGGEFIDDLVLFNFPQEIAVLRKPPVDEFKSFTA